MRNRTPILSIADIHLEEFRAPIIDGNRGLPWRSIWYILNALFFQSVLFGLIPSRLKAWILRLFGAKIGVGFVCKPKVNIKYPWFLIVGDNCWLGEGVWIDNLCEVTIGNNVCISQGAVLITGSHDWSDRGFRFFCRPISIGDGTWITAFRVIRPGTKVPAGVAVVGDLSPQLLSEVKFVRS